MGPGGAAETRNLFFRRMICAWVSDAGRCGLDRQWGVGMRAWMARLVSPAAAVVLGGVALVLMIADVPLAGLAHQSLTAGGGSLPVWVSVPFAVVGFVVAWRKPGNPLGWIILGTGVFLALSQDASFYAVAGYRLRHGGLPLGWVSLLAQPGWVPAFALFGLAILLFPDGRPPSPRLRWMVWVFAAVSLLWIGSAVIITVGAIRGHHTQVDSGGNLLLLNSGSHQSPAWWTVLSSVFIMLGVACWLVSLAAQVLSYRRSSGERRQQLKWLMAGSAVALISFTTAAAILDGVPAGFVGVAGFLAIPLSIGVAVMRYRLLDIDVVISKAVLYGSLAVFITAVYAGLVVGVGTLAGGRDRPLLAALAAAVVAVAFQPVRQWAGRLANRVVYGRRATPYQVLSEFARRIGGTYSAQGVLPQMAQTVAAGTGAEQVVVWLRVDDELRPEASSDGSPHAGSLPVAGHELPRLPDADISAPVVHQGELLGAISVQMPKDEPVRPAGEQLVTDVASQAGLVLANAGLIEDLRASRQRLVTAQDEGRRRLERNIHDGAQQDLVALGIKLRLADMTVDDPVQTRELLGELQTDAAGALANLRDLARGIYPPLLADLGLAAALGAQASKSPVPVTVDAGEIGRFPQDIEAAVYFCCLEALQNAAKYAHATQARICVQTQGGTLRFTVADDGMGYDDRHTPLGSGQRNMADRLAALGGRLEVQSAPGQGTTVTGHLPVPSCTPAGTGS
jgi:signal transduction histidine kinase